MNGQSNDLIGDDAPAKRRREFGEKASAKILLQRAQEMLKAKTAQLVENTEVLSLEQVRDVLHDLSVHQIELEMQNEELRQAQIELEIARSRYFDLYDLAPVGYGTVDAHGMIVQANLTLAMMLGVVRGELIRQPISHFIVKSDQDRYYFMRKQLLETDESQTCELRLLKPNGGTLWAQVAASSARDADNTLTFRLAISDITELKTLERALQQSEQRWRSIAENPFDFTLVIDRQYRFIYVNHVAPGITMESLIGKATPFDFCDAQYHAVMRAAYDLTFATGKASTYETYSPKLKGWYSSIVGAVREQGEVTSISILTREITKEKRAEEQQRELQAKLQQTQKLESLGVLAGGIAHDFNNLLTSMLGYSELALRELPSGSPAQKYIHQTISGGRRAAELTRQLLAYTGKGHFVVEPVNLSALTKEISHFLRVSLSKNCLINHELASNLASVNADVAQMQQVIMNLIINAAESIGDRTGEITLRTGVMHGDQESLSGTFYDETLPEGPYVFLEVSDNGCGMSEDTQKKLFDPFFTTKFTGRGLGLSAVLGIIRGHRGAIRVHTEVGKGTTFRVMFPTFDAPAKIKEETEVNVIDWRGRGTILLVDDDHAVLGLTRIMLEQMGFSVLTAIDGIEAVDIFRSQAERICLVLIDKIMPRLNGEQSFQEMRALRSDVRAILMSGYAEQSAVGQMDGKGFAGFIQKPFAIVELTTVIRTVIGQ